MARSSTSGIGRPKGVPNKITRTVREAYEHTFKLLQESDGKASLTNWAQANPTEFYKISSKLIPNDLNIQGQLTLNVLTGVPQANDDLA